MQRLHWYWDRLRSGLWFIPSLLAVTAIVLAVGLTEVDARIDRAGLADRWPRLFGAGAAGARGMLAAIASSMITVAGVAFSITIVALTLASSQYTSRVLRNFMRDRANQTVLGLFLGIFVYCIVVLRTIRGGDEGAFVPSLAVLAGVALALVGIGSLIFFIHHIALSIQAESIVKSAAEETIRAIDRLFPADVGDAAAPNAPEPAGDRRVWRPVPATRTGYIQGVDADGLLRFAEEGNAVVRMEYAVGEFVVAGSPLVSVAGDRPPAEDAAARVNALYAVGRQRTTVQDAGFGVRQIVDIALKALSPGVNDTTTAVLCVEYLTAILAHLAPRRVESPLRATGGDLRVIARGLTFPGVLGEAFDQIRWNAPGNVTVMTAMLNGLAVVAARTGAADRRAAVRRQAELVATGIGAVSAAADREGIEAAARRLSDVLTGAADVQVINNHT